MVRKTVKFDDSKLGEPTSSNKTLFLLDTLLVAVLLLRLAATRLYLGVKQK
jgi:hypothetical protein